MSVLTTSDTQLAQQLLNNMSVALQEVLKMTEAVKQQLQALSEHNISKSSHSDIRTDIVCVQEDVDSVKPRIHDNNLYTGPVVMELSENGTIANIGFIDPNVVVPEETPPDTSL